MCWTGLGVGMRFPTMRYTRRALIPSRRTYQHNAQQRRRYPRPGFAYLATAVLFTGIGVPAVVPLRSPLAGNVAGAVAVGSIFGFFLLLRLAETTRQPATTVTNRPRLIGPQRRQGVRVHGRVRVGDRLIGDPSVAQPHDRSASVASRT